ERALGLDPLPDGALRLGVVGAPRAEKDVQLVLDGFHACGRDDLRLFVACLDGEEVPDDPRIVATPYTYVSPADYAAQLACVDALVLPSAPAGMLTTGTVADVVGLGLPALVSAWGYLTETLGGAGLPYGETPSDLTDRLASLTAADLAGAAAHARALQEPFG